LASNQNLTMESEKKILSEPTCSNSIERVRVYSAGGDLSKRWFVYYYKDIGAGVTRRVRIYDNINKYATMERRMDRALEIIQLIIDGDNAVTGHGEKKHSNDLQKVLKKVLLQKQHLLRKKSFQTYASQLKIFSDWLKFNKVMKLTEFKNKQAVMFLQHLQSCGHSGTTVNNYSQSLRSLFANLVTSGAIRENPFDKIKKCPEERRGSLYFKPEQVSRLKVIIAEKEPALWLACQFIYYCFIRPGELRNLKVSDVYGDESKILLRSTISKNKKSEFVSIPTAFAPIIAAMQLYKYPDDYYLIGRDGVPAQHQVSTSFLGKRHLMLLREQGFRSGYNLYSWKHTGVVMAHNNGINAKELKDQLRHHSLDMVAIYLKSMGLDDFGNLRKNFPQL